MLTTHQTVLRSTAHTRAIEAQEHLATAGRALLDGRHGDAITAVDDANRCVTAVLERLSSMMDREPKEHADK